MNKTTRRDFLRYSSIGLGGIFLAACGIDVTPMAVATQGQAAASPDPTSTSIATQGQAAATLAPTAKVTNRTVGLFLNDPRACPGYTLLAPKQNMLTYLIDNEGRIVNTWTSQYPPGQSAYLLPDGNLMRAAMVRNPDINTGGGEGGRIEEFDWDGNLVWSVDYSTNQHMQHHDFVALANGNVLMLVCEKKTYQEALAAGFNPGLIPDAQAQGYILPDSIIEINPTRPAGGTVVWEWHVWDHLVQDYSPSKSNFGNVAANPGLINPNGDGRQIPVFWNHMNSIAYHPGLDQVMVSVRGNSEIWILDHSTTLQQAAGHTGGKYGRGGDLIYRWGNPVQYGAGSQQNEMLFQEHDAVWIDANCPGAGDILIFNNGAGRGYSTVDEITPPVDEQRGYVQAAGSAFGPTGLTWTYRANPLNSFYSDEISGAQRLPNGNTLICLGVNGTLFEVTSGGEMVWKYVNPVVNTGPLGPSDSIPADPARPDQSLNELFKVQRYAPDYPGLVGRNLTPAGIIEK